MLINDLTKMLPFSKLPCYKENTELSSYCNRRILRLALAGSMTEPNSTQDIDYISKDEERVTHLYPNDCYFTHLSIYRFAAQYCQGGHVLDAGSGAGYGSAYLAEQGAKSVVGVDLSEDAVTFSRKHFVRPNLEYQVMDVGNITGFSSGQFDLIFSSNTLEHVPRVFGFFNQVWHLVNAEGTLIVAVPPITHSFDWTGNIANPYHLNIWTPFQWFRVLCLFFEDIQPYWHRFSNPKVRLDFWNTPEQTVITEQDFDFQPVGVEAYAQNPTLTAIFLARSPQKESDLPSEDIMLQFVDRSFTRQSPLGQNIWQANWWQYKKFHVLKRYGWRFREIHSQEGIKGVWKRFVRKFTRR
jgi:SAM-dependent methyltransferase